jgi:hypothetical protein
MGAAEWSLLGYRRRARRMLRTFRDVGAFRRRARGALLLAWLQYVSGAIVLVAIGAVVAVGSGLVHRQQIIVPEAAGYLMLGSAMFLALLLQTMRVWALPLAAAVTALATELIFRQYGEAIQVAVPAALLIVLGCYSVALLGAAVRHGY